MNINSLTQPVTGDPVGPSKLGLQPQGGYVDRLKDWYIRPIQSLKSPHDGFAILALLFPIWEKWLRWKYDYDGSFSEGCKPLRDIGRAFGLDDKQSLAFWSRFRNGLLHRCSPTDEANYLLVGEGTGCIWFDGEVCVVNPFNLRDTVIFTVSQDLNKLFKSDEDCPIPKVFVPKPC